LDPDNGWRQNGFRNIEAGGKYQAFTSALHEAVLSFGVGVEFGGTGSKTVGAESFSTISPAFFFGKGFGDLPEPLKYLRPLAITGVGGLNFPTRSRNVILHNGETEIESHPVTFIWGGSVQYNFQYLQSFVKDIGLRSPFDRMIPIVEVPLETCLNRGCGGETRGSVNPGLIWFGKFLQLGLEAVIPINPRSGKHVGALGMVHFFIDDLFPNSLGRPILR
jgi:hypothetical protein